jgi:hypothetical protein
VNVLIGFESSGRVRDAFAAKGHNAASCDLLPSEAPGNHYQCDIFELLDKTLDFWDLFIFHPPCTFVCGSGIHWNKRRPERAVKTQEAIEFAKRLWTLPFKKGVMENPVGVLSSVIGKPQVIQPYNFGEDASKATCLWLRGLPRLNGTSYFPPRVVQYNGKEVKRWSNQTDSGQNRLAPSEDRWKERSRTYLGIAKAMADQWGAL